MKGQFLLFICTILVLTTFAEEEAPNECTNKPDFTKFPHEYDCRKFYLCQDGVKLEKMCYAGLHFSPEWHYCMPKDEAECEQITTTPETTSTTPTTTTERTTTELTTPETTSTTPTTTTETTTTEVTTPETTSTTPTTTTEITTTELTTPKTTSTTPTTTTETTTTTELTTPGPEISTEAPNQCSDKPDFTKYPHEYDCRKFYLCLNGEKLEKMCYRGLHFSPTWRYCMPMEEAECEQITTTPETTSTTASTTTETTTTEVTTPTPEISTEAPYHCYGQPDFTKFPHEYDCRKFYLCLNGEKLEKMCYRGLHFSPNWRYCMPMEEAECEQITTTPETTSTTIGCNTSPATTPETTTSQETTTPEIETTTKNPLSYCKGQPLGTHIRYFGDCTKFIVCIGGGVVKDCPSPLHFNVVKQICDWPESAKCPWA